MELPRRHHFNQLLSMISYLETGASVKFSKEFKIFCHMTDATRRVPHHFCDILAKAVEPESKCEKTQIQSEEHSTE